MSDDLRTAIRGAAKTLLDNEYISSWPQGLFCALEKTVVDETTLRLIQVDDLFTALNYTTTKMGAATLYRSLLQPPTLREHVLAKQDGLRELEANDRVRQAVEDYVGEYSQGEGRLFEFLDRHDNHQETFSWSYEPFKEMARAGVNISKAASSLPKVESSYLQVLFADIRQSSRSRTHQLMDGPIYKTRKNGRRDILTKDEVGFFTFATRFRPTRFSSAATTVMAAPLLGLLGASSQEEIFMLTGMSLFTTQIGAAYNMKGKLNRDYRGVFIPLRRQALADRTFKNAVDGVGYLDELLSFSRYAKEMPFPTSLPKIQEGDHHSFFGREVRNPVLAKGKEDFVPNDINLENDRLAFVTGPNSGGKTTICKTLEQTQLVGQIGNYVASPEVIMTLADRIRYQAPTFDALQDEEGRFGTELKRTRDIFFETTPKSLVILDELSEGTTLEEKMATSRVIIDGFTTIGGTTLVVTHNHALAQEYQDKKIGQSWQVEFNGEKPTHRIVEGISRQSHAQRVAEKIGFAKQDIENHLEKKGYRSKGERK